MLLVKYLYAVKINRIKVKVNLIGLGSNKLNIGMRIIRIIAARIEFVLVSFIL